MRSYCWGDVMVLRLTIVVLNGRYLRGVGASPHARQPKLRAAASSICLQVLRRERRLSLRAKRCQRWISVSRAACRSGKEPIALAIWMACRWKLCSALTGLRVCEFNTCTPSKAVEGSSASWSTSVLLTRHCRVRVSVCLHHRSTARTLCRGVHSTYCSSG